VSAVVQTQNQVLNVLLQSLLEQGLIPQKTFDSAANIINSTLDFEEFFWYPVCCKEEGEDHGCS
jgi:hypothetical protein